MIWGRGNDEIWKFGILTIFGKNCIISMCESMRILVFFLMKYLDIQFRVLGIA